MSEAPQGENSGKTAKPRRHRTRKPNLKNSESRASPSPAGTRPSNNKESAPNPKYLEINKLIKKYHPVSFNGVAITALQSPLQQLLKKSTDLDIYLGFHLKPSDPEFLFDLEILKFSLYLPLKYPFYQNQEDQTRPSIVVLNKDIPRGFSVNIEIGFNEIIDLCVQKKLNKKSKRNRHRKSRKEEENVEEEEETELQLVQGTDLTSIIMTLDKYLEMFLSRQKKDTIKIVRYKKPQLTAVPPVETPKPKPIVKTPSVVVPVEIAEMRATQIRKFIQRLEKEFKIKKFKTTPSNDIYSLDIPLIENGLVVKVDPQIPDLHIDHFPCRLHIPTDYLYNEQRGLKLEIDKNFLINVLSQYEDSSQRLEFSKRINRLIGDFNNKISTSFVKDNVSNLNLLKHSITSQMNFFVHNCQALLDGTYV